jgi:large subunit ribosomal protein L13
MKRAKHTIDATGIALGKLAVIVAVLLRGKNKPGFDKHLDEGDYVVVKNFKNVKITGKKVEQRVTYHYSGHMGGLKPDSLKVMLVKKPAEVLRRAAYRMLPDNKLRDRMIQRLTVVQ